jgi:hypothetical protein
MCSFGYLLGWLVSRDLAVLARADGGAAAAGLAC